MTRALLRAAQRLRRDERGGVMAEAVLILPLLAWAYVAMFVYWDAYRAQNTAVKASYTVADMVSRELNPITCSYMTGMKTVFDFLLDGDQATGLIITSVTWNAEEERHEVVWSLARGGGTALTTASLQQNLNKLPKMSDGDTVILVQTRVSYEPSISVGVPEFDFTQFIVTRPRRAAAGISTSCTV
jgi:Flp pilus assembly protein TadG